MALWQPYQEIIINKVTSVVIELGDVNLLADNFSLVLVMMAWELKTFHARFPVATLGLRTEICRPKHPAAREKNL